LRQRNQPILDVRRPLLLDEPDAVEAVGGLGVKNLREDALAGFVLLPGIS
jgi:hypothetical protein